MRDGSWRSPRPKGRLIEERHDTCSAAALGAWYGAETLLISHCQPSGFMKAGIETIDTIRTHRNPRSALNDRLGQNTALKFSSEPQIRRQTSLEVCLETIGGLLAYHHRYPSVIVMKLCWSAAGRSMLESHQVMTSRLKGHNVPEDISCISIS